MILEIRNNPNITSSQLANILGISTTAVEKSIRYLKDNGCIAVAFVVTASDRLTSDLAASREDLIMSQSWGWDPWFKCASARQTGPIYLRVA